MNPEPGVEPREDPADDPVDDQVEQALARWLDRVDAGEPADGALDALCAALPADAARALRRRAALLGDMGVLPGAAPTDDDRAPPERLGRFRILGPLGGGGMGVVYRAVDEELGREVALKVVRPDQLFQPGVRARFRREVEIIARLQHPGIVPVYSVGEADGVPYFAMERVRGCSLDRALAVLRARRASPAQLTGADLARAVGEAALHDAAAEGAPGDPASAEPARGESWLFAGSWEETCVRVVAQLAEALAHAHREGVVHRDIKPSNVMLSHDRDGSRARLLDFGLASTRDAGSELTRSGSRLGSLHYMSPEQTRGEPAAVGPASDVYSLGVTLYELLTLQRPFRADDEHGVVSAIREGAAPGVSTLNPAVSWEAATVCATAMEREPARRYAGAEALARDLGNVLARRPVEARPASAWRRARRWVQRRPTLAVSLALGALLLVGAPLVFTWQQLRANADLAAQLAATEEQRRVAEQERRAAEQQRALAQQARDAEAAARVTAEAARARAEANQALALEAVDRMLTRLAADELRYLPQMEPVRARLLEDAVALSAQLLERAADDPGARAAAADAHARRGELLAALGRTDDALDDLRAAETLYADLAAQATGAPAARLDAERAAVAGRRATLLADSGRAEQAHALHATEDARLAAALQAQPGDPRLRLARARNDHLLGRLHAAAADPREAASFAAAETPWTRAEQTLRALIAEAEAAHAAPTPDTPEALERAALHARLGSVLHDRGQLALARFATHEPGPRALLEAALVERERAVALAPRDADHVLALLATRLNLSSVLRHEERHAEALDVAAGALPSLEALAAARPEVLHVKVQLATVHNQIGLAHDHLGHEPEALAAYERARAVLAELVERAPQLAELHDKLGIAELNVGAKTLNTGAYDDAREHFAAAVRHQQEAVRLRPDDLSLRRSLRTHRVAQFDLALRTDDPAAALLAARRMGEAAPDDWAAHTGAAAHAARVVLRLAEGAGAALTEEQRADLRAQAVEQGVASLRAAVDAGFPALHELEQVPALDPLRGEPAFEAFLAEVRATRP